MLLPLFKHDPACAFNLAPVRRVKRRILNVALDGFHPDFAGFTDGKHLVQNGCMRVRSMIFCQPIADVLLKFLFGHNYGSCTIF